MYDEIIKFLKDKSRKMTKEEACEFLKLLVKCVGIDEEIQIDASLCTSELDGSTEINFIIDSIDIDDLSTDSYSLDGLSDEEEEYIENVELSKRKIRRNTNFKRVKMDKENVDIGIEKTARKERESKTVEDIVSEEDSKTKEKGKTVEDIVSEEDSKTKEKGKTQLTNILLPNIEQPKTEKVDKKNKDISEKIDIFKVLNKPVEFKLPGVIDNSVFVLPSEDKKEEFQFDLGELDEFHKNGPDYKFYDEERKEL